MQIRDTRYARTPDGVYIAYQVAGDGPIDLAWGFDFTGNVDLAWEWPLTGRLLRALASSCRVILHDRRGTGLSSRNVAAPNLETRVSDLRLVLDEVGSECPVLGGINEAGAPNVMLAATEPQRVRSIVWLEPFPRVMWAPDFPWGVKDDYAQLEDRSLDLWGSNEYGEAWAAAEAAAGMVLSPEQRLMAGVMSRHTATPDMARELDHIWYETDVRAVLPSVQAPTLLVPRKRFPRKIDVATYVASLIPDATVAPVSGDFGPDDMEEVLAILHPFLGLEPRRPELETVLATVLFTDIVGSTRKQSALGDHAWKKLVERHHAMVRDALTNWRGVENDTAGDGFYTTFDGPARAIRCALEVTERVQDLGIEIRAGIHTGECELIDGKAAGLSVSIGARVARHAAASEVLVSQTVKDLVAGSGFSFQDRGEKNLTGVPDRWHLFRVMQADARPSIGR
jgi:class 3 adenylate cyclase/pimeloyl-ACP methyl ester carboxylesterase